MGQFRGYSVYTLWSGSDFPAVRPPAGLQTGGAGLWTFAFANASGSTGLVSVFNGTTIPNGFVPLSSPCGAAGGPFAGEKTRINPTNVTDPASLADPAYRSVSTVMDLNSTPVVEFFVLGAPAVPYFQYEGTSWSTTWQISFGTCGLPGVTGLTPLHILTDPQTSPGVGWTYQYDCSAPY
ncbi:MAG TPA: hypothetical protein VGP88_02830 [Thermoplasmata archaeon]|nr:hypothetical protein [Thermoplasmata archaeon]